MSFLISQLLYDRLAVVKNLTRQTIAIYQVNAENMLNLVKKDENVGKVRCWYKRLKLSFLAQTWNK